MKCPLISGGNILRPIIVKVLGLKQNYPLGVKVMCDVQFFRLYHLSTLYIHWHYIVKLGTGKLPSPLDWIRSANQYPTVSFKGITICFYHNWFMVRVSSINSRNYRLILKSSKFMAVYCLVFKDNSRCTFLLFECSCHILQVHIEL